MLEFNTSKLQEMVSKLNKCGNSKLLEITRYWHIYAHAGEGVRITAMDGNNYITVMDRTVNGEADVIVRADQFGKLVEKTSVDKISICEKDNYLSVIGNGDYKVEIVTGETYPYYKSLQDDVEPCLVKTEVLKSISTVNRSTVSTQPADGFLTGYLVTPRAAITSDSIKVCINPVEFLYQTVLLTPEFLKLAQTITTETCDIYYKDMKLEIVNHDTVIYGAEMEGKELFPDLTQYAKAELPFRAKVSRLGIQQIIDRLTLFLGEFDNGDIQMYFDNQILTISTNSGSYEKIKLVPDEDNSNEFQCSINVTFLKDILSSIQDETFYICYGDEGYVKIEDGDKVYVLATNEEV